jgi:hypothetical protein
MQTNYKLAPTIISQKVKDVLSDSITDIDALIYELVQGAEENGNVEFYDKTEGGTRVYKYPIELEGRDNKTGNPLTLTLTVITNETWDNSNEEPCMISSEYVAIILSL